MGFVQLEQTRKHNKQPILHIVQLEQGSKQSFDKCRFDIPFWKNGVGKSC